MRKTVTGPDYNLVFDSNTGVMARWGRTLDDDPLMCPLGPEIVDIEVSTICHGVGPSVEARRPCSWCYKANSGTGANMNLETFCRLLSKLPRSVMQVALGIGDIDGNPDLWAILKACRDKDIVPNLTVNGMGVTDEVAQKLAALCGAMAVSHYSDDICFDAVERLSRAGLKQVNIHQLLAASTYEICFRLLAQTKADPRLHALKAIVFLLAKPRVRGSVLGRYILKSISLQQHLALLDRAKEMGVSIGMDSCSAPMALKALGNDAVMCIEPCESGLFSLYINVRGDAFPCSFTENPNWRIGNALEIEDFVRDIWESPRLETWRNTLWNSSSKCQCEMRRHCRSCPAWNVTTCREDDR